MPVPDALKKESDVHIFKYSSDLSAAVTKLQERLGISVPIMTVKTTVSPATFSGYEAGKKIAWLVGHGEPTDTTVGTMNKRQHALKLEDIIDWLKGEGYTTIVDTCCAPKLRRKCNMKGLDYYCAKDDNRTVTCNEDHPSLDHWWDANSMQKEP